MDFPIHPLGAPIAAIPSDGTLNGDYNAVAHASGLQSDDQAFAIPISAGRSLPGTKDLDRYDRRVRRGLPIH
jgi:hypothetical protein